MHRHIPARLIGMLVLQAVAALALDNSVLLENYSGSGVGAARHTSSAQLTARPVSISRWFAQGEIAHFPSPYMNNTAITPWQSDCKNHWTDGSAQFCIVSFTVNVPAGGSVQVDFRDSANPCSSGNQAACDAAALDSAGMLNFDPGRGQGTWGACTAVTAGAPTTYTFNARTIVGDGKFFYWLRGPVVTQVVARDYTTFAYNKGWHWNGTTMSEDVTDKYQSLAPQFELTFYPGWSGVKIDYVLENDLLGRRQDQRYALALWTDSTCATQAYSKATFTQLASSRWHKTFWDGSRPGDVRTDLNTAYLSYAKALPFYDPSLIGNTAMVNDVGSLYSGPNGSPYSGISWTASGNDRGEIGGTATMDPSYAAFEPAITSHDLEGTLLFLTWDARMWDLWFGTGMYDATYAVSGGGGLSDVVSHAPFNFREGRTTSPPAFCARSCSGGNASVSSVGKVLSMDAYTSERASAGPGDTAVGTVTSGPWSFQAAHDPDSFLLPYLVTGDYYFLEAEWLSATEVIGVVNPGTVNNGGAPQVRQSFWGFCSDNGQQIRGAGHCLKKLFNAWMIAPDGTPEKEYWASKIRNNIGVREGIMQLAKGQFYPAGGAASCASINTNSTNYNDLWCVGYQGFGYKGNNPLSNWIVTFSQGGAGECQFPWLDGRLDCSLAYSSVPSWFARGTPFQIFRLAEFNFPQISSLAQAMAEYHINQTLAQGVNPAANWAAYRMPFTTQALPRQRVTNATKASSSVITVPGNGFATGDKVALCCPTGGANAGSNGWANLTSATAAGETITVDSVDTFHFSSGPHNTTNGTGADFASTGQIVYAVKASNGPQISTWADWSAAAGVPSRVVPSSYDYAAFATALWSMLPGYQIDKDHTGNRAWEWAHFNCPRGICGTGNYTYPRHALIPRPQVGNLRQVDSNLFFTAPDGAACSYAFDPASSLTTQDLPIPRGNRERTVSLVGHSPGSSLRITCGDARTTYVLH